MKHKGFQHSFAVSMMWVFLKCVSCNYNCPPASPKYTHLNGTKGSFFSPNYPDNYPVNMTHIWRITIAAKLRIQLHVFIDELQERKLTNQADCLDYIEIKDDADNSRNNSIARICGKRRVTSFLSNSGNVSITLTSDCSVASKGFKAVFSVFQLCIVHNAIKPEFLSSFVHVIEICPEGWFYFDSSCYKVFRSRLTWSKARKKCQEMNGDLVSISNADEQQLISGMTSWKGDEHYWLGLNDGEREGEYQWSDGSRFRYENWKRLEPNDDLGREDCVEVASKDPKWNDDYCEKKYGFICKTSRASTVYAGGWIVVGLLYTVTTLYT